MGDSLLHEAMCSQRHELWLKVGYMKMCVDREMKCGYSWLHEAVCSQRHEL